MEIRSLKLLLIVTIKFISILFIIFNILTLNVKSLNFLKKVAIIYKSLYIINNKLHNKDISGGHY